VKVIVVYLTVTLTNGVPIETVSKMFGHLTIKNNSGLCSYSCY